MKQNLGILLFILVFSQIGFAQDEDRPAPKRPTNSESNEPKKDEKPAPFTPFKKKKGFDIEKLLVEPAVGFSVSQNYFNLNLRPYVGYNVWKGLYVGGGITYIYQQFNDYQVSTPAGNRGIKYADQVIGGGVFLQYRIWKGFFARTTFEFLNRKFPTTASVQPNGTVDVNYKRVNIPVLLIGGGYNFSIAKFISMPLAVYYNVLGNNKNAAYSIYPRSVVIQLGLVTLM